MMNLFLKCLMTLTIALALTSCATITQGKYQQIGFNSDPMGAKVIVDNQYIGITPTSTRLTRADTHQVIIELEGFKPYAAQICPSLSGWIFGNIIFGGPIGVAVDVVTGSMYKLSPSQMNACLQAQEGCVLGKLQAGTSGKVVIVSEADSSWEKFDSLEKNNS